MVVGSSASGSHQLYRSVERIGWSGVAKNFGHIDLHIEPVQTPMLGEVALAAARAEFGSDLFVNEGTTRIVCLIVLTIIELKNVFIDDKLKQVSEYISTEGTLEGLHNPKEFREFQERVRR
jgi:hypothetical protein